MSLEVLQSYYSAYHNVINMLVRRGYDFTPRVGSDIELPCSPAEAFKVSLEAIKQKFRDNELLSIYAPLDDNEKQVIVIFRTEPDFSKREHTWDPPGAFGRLFTLTGHGTAGTTKELKERLVEILSVYHVIIVYSHPSKSSVERDVKFPDLEYFHIDDIENDIMDSRIQPDFKLLRRHTTEHNLVATFYKKDEMSLYAKDDKVVRYYYGKPGDIFQIMNPAGVRYRIVGDFNKEKK